jgi:ribosome-binding protein aMBF1 (putative translation factor)
MTTHFDTKPVILRRTLTTDEKLKKGVLTTESKIDAGKNKSSDTGLDKRKVEAGLLAPPKTTHELSTGIQKARSDKKLTREQLAMKLGVTKDIIAKLETPGTLLANISHLDQLFTKLNKTLGTIFKKPKNTVLAPEQDKRTP